MSTGQIFFVVGIVGMLATAVASVISARILSKQKKKMKEYGSIIGEGPDNDSGDKGW